MSGRLPVMRIGSLECALAESQAVKGCGKKAECCDDGEADVRTVSSKQHEELADEIA